MTHSWFKEIVDGWLLIDSFDDVTERLERIAEHVKQYGPLTPDEEVTVKLMIEVQMARAEREGHGLLTDPDA